MRHIRVVSNQTDPGRPAGSSELFVNYPLDAAYDELFEAPTYPRPHYRALVEELASVQAQELQRRQGDADRAFLTQGLTFTVYGDEQGTERIFPFDPTNNLIASDRHVRVAIGRDYADVPPTRGVYKGWSAVRSELAVAVRVGPATSPFAGEVLPFTPWMSRDAGAPAVQAEAAAQSDQQQQQQ